MRRDDRNDPFDDIFRELERMMNDVMGGGVEVGDAGFGSDTHVDVQETSEEIRVIADLPGVEKGDIGLTCDGKALTISAQNNRREYDERVALPSQVDEHSARATYNNGILEVTLARADGSAEIDVD
jgi:HSP20 family protein